MCEWWYNVLCENSEKLYDKNAELYPNAKQNDETSNDQKSGNDNRDIEYSKSWNYHNNPNENQMNNNDNLASHHRHHKHHHKHHNHRPHSHYSGNEDEANSNRQELLSKAPASATAAVANSAAEIDIDLSNDESKDRFVKAVANQQTVSKFGDNKTKNIVFLT